MATVTQVVLTCDMCGSVKDVRTRAFGLDGKTYEIDLCPKDSNGLSKAAAGFTSKARKTTARHSARRNGGHTPRARAESAAISERAGGSGRARGPERKVSAQGRVTEVTQKEAKTSRSKQQAAKVSGAKAKPAGSGEEGAKARRPGEPKPAAASKQPDKAGGVPRDKGIFVYGILPADIEVADEMRGVGEHPGLLRVVRCEGVAALISEVGTSGRLGTADDQRIHREILDATAAELPVLPLRFGTVLASEDAARELLAARHDEFAAALEQLEGRAQFLVKGRYIEDAVLHEVDSHNKKAAQLRDAIEGNDPDAGRDARIALGEIINEEVAVMRKEDTRVLEQAMEGICVASVVREPAHDLDAVDVAFLVAADEQNEVERVIEDLAREWEGRVDVQLLGPMAAYDFAGTAQPED